MLPLSRLSERNFSAPRDHNIRHAGFRARGGRRLAQGTIFLPFPSGESRVPAESSPKLVAYSFGGKDRPMDEFCTKEVDRKLQHASCMVSIGCGPRHRLILYERRRHVHEANLLGL